MPYKKASEPQVRPSRRKGSDAPPLKVMASLVQAAPLTLLCMACRTPRVARTDRVVLWHPDAIDPAYECAGGGAPGLDMDGVHREGRGGGLSA